MSCVDGWKWFEVADAMFPKFFSWGGLMPSFCLWGVFRHSGTHWIYLLSLPVPWGFLFSWLIMNFMLSFPTWTKNQAVEVVVGTILSFCMVTPWSLTQWWTSFLEASLGKEKILSVSVENSSSSVIICLKGVSFLILSQTSLNSTFKEGSLA